MTGENVGWSTFPPELMHAAEDGGYFATCDLGSCDQETAGWAFWREQCEWITGCDGCLRRASDGGSSVVFLADITACFAYIDANASSTKEPS
jgi:hypothetical protein